MQDLVLEPRMDALYAITYWDKEFPKKIIWQLYDEFLEGDLLEARGFMTDRIVFLKR